MSIKTIHIYQVCMSLNKMHFFDCENTISDNFKTKQHHMVNDFPKYPYASKNYDIYIYSL